MRSGPAGWKSITHANVLYGPLRTGCVSGQGDKLANYDTHAATAGTRNQVSRVQ